MPSIRVSLLSTLFLVGALPCYAVAQTPVEWYTDTGSGGALAQPPQESKNGGAVAPSTATGEVDGAESDISATPPVVSSAAQAEEPVLDDRSDEPRAERPDRPAEAAQDAPAVTGGEDQSNSDAGQIASLPLTGLELAGLVAAGLCLLVVGAVLRPRRSAA
jgi:uncharacterized surface anchored protein